MHKLLGGRQSDSDSQTGYLLGLSRNASFSAKLQSLLPVNSPIELDTVPPMRVKRVHVSSSRKARVRTHGHFQTILLLEVNVFLIFLASSKVLCID